MSRRNTIPTSQESTESILHKSCQVDCDGTIFPTKITEVKHGRRNEIVGVTVGYEDASSEIIDHWPPSFVTFDDDDPMNLPLQSEDNMNSSFESDDGLTGTALNSILNSGGDDVMNSSL